MAFESALKIAAYGAWNGGRVVDNRFYENKGMFFKNNIEVNHRTIEARIGVRQRVAAPDDVRIGKIAFKDLLAQQEIDPSRIKLLIGATNVGEDKYDAGPLIKYPMELLQAPDEDLSVFDLYAGCPGFNVAVELVFMLSLSGHLKKGDLSVIVGAENIHRAKPFRPLDTAGIIFGDDSLATALETGEIPNSGGTLSAEESHIARLGEADIVGSIAHAICELTGGDRIDGLILDNQLGQIEHRVPATASRVQHQMVKRLHPDAAAEGVFSRFKSALAFYDRHVRSFAFDIMSLKNDPEFVKRIGEAYVRSGKYRKVVTGYLGRDLTLVLTFHRGQGFCFSPPRSGIVDTATSTHGCFAHYIQAVSDSKEVFGEMDGKGVFLYATRGAGTHLEKILPANDLTLFDLDLLIEHQANFAMIPLTLEQLMAGRVENVKQAVGAFLADRMLTNVHTRGNCSVVCMQRLPYDLFHDRLEPDTIQGFPVNRNLDALKSAGMILNDSVGAGMTRSSFLQRIEKK